MKNKLHENQLYLLRHLARFQLLSYSDCLELLDTEGTKDLTALSYAFRPLTKNKYISKQRDGGVSILAKGRALFPETEPLISTGGGAAERRRVMEVSRMAALMERNGVPVVEEPIGTDQPHFIPSACWRKIVPGILSTTRFAGMLIMEEDRIAVYDIGDGRMEWQGRAEGSLFHPRYGTYEVQATGMLLICRDGLRNSVAEQIIRYTMWQRRQLLHDRLPAQRERPVRWSRAPIRLRKLYGRVYLTTPSRFRRDLERILAVPREIQARCGDDGVPLHDPAQGDYERGNYRGFVCYAADLLKYVYFFSAVRALMRMLDDPGTQPPALRYEIYIHEGDEGLLALYPDCLDLEGLNIYVYQPKKDLRNIERRLPEDREPTQRELRQAYDTVLRLRSQVLAALQDREDFEGAQGLDGERIAAQKSGGALWGRAVILSFQEPLPSQKELTAAVEEYWVDMLHTAFQKVAEQGALPHFQKALVVIHIATPRGSDNTKVWDTSNRAIQVILNNLKGVLFPDDDMEHMAFAVAGYWAEGDGYTIVQVSDFSECQQVFRIPYERLRSSLGIGAADLQTDTLGTEIQ